MNIAALIDHTLLKAEATAGDIARLCCEAREFGFWSVCVNPCHVRRAATALTGPARSGASSNVKICTVIGFPLGANLTETKVYETRFALRDGASEIDMIINIGALKAGDDAVVLADLQSVVQAVRESDALCKVIFETCLLTHDEKVRACELCVKAGVDFVKTSTGLSTGGATVEDVALMSRLVKPHGIGVKASGGIRTLANLKKMVAAGATRIGTTRGVKIMQEAAAS
ncbi:MAG: deoxyribose-phosphate aldolase [Verrucomicrobiia bacterium]